MTDILGTIQKHLSKLSKEPIAIIFGRRAYELLVKQIESFMRYTCNNLSKVHVFGLPVFLAPGEERNCFWFLNKDKCLMPIFIEGKYCEVGLNE